MNSAPGWGGGERMFLELALGFRAAGHAVTVVARPGSALAARLPAEMPRHLLPCRGDFDLRTLLGLHRLLRDGPCDAVLCNWGRDCVLAGVAAWPRRIPVVRVKALEETRRNLRNLFIYRVLLAAVVSVSTPVQDGLRELHIPAERLRIIHNGVDIVPPPIDRAAARTHYGAGTSDFVVAYIGRLVREKGVDLLPETTAHLRGAGVPVRLFIAGEGNLRSEIEAACDRHNLGDHVHFLGFVDDPLPLLAAADAAVMPSRTEAFPVAALEALALGTPLVACRAGGLTEIITDEETGLLVEPENPAAIAAALRRVYQEPELAQRLREQGRRHAGDFSRAVMIARYEELIRELRQPGK
jgi:glycosyltransferase involved in cell wall biosynthesis